jgi:uncharacterized protein (DUF2267 family)
MSEHGTSTPRPAASIGGVRRIGIDAVNVTLRGCPADEADRLAAGLPAAIAAALDGRAAEATTSAVVARAVVARIRAETGGEPTWTS